MSGPYYVGFLVEQWRPEREPAVVMAAAQGYAEHCGSAERAMVDLRVSEHMGAAWLQMDVEARGHDVSDVTPLAGPIAAAAESAVWRYAYMDTTAFGIEAERVAPDGTVLEKVSVGDSTDVDDDAVAQDGGHALRHLQLRVARRLVDMTGWSEELLLTDESFALGPALIDQIPPQTHDLVPLINTLKPRAPSNGVPSNGEPVSAAGSSGALSAPLLSLREALELLIPSLQGSGDRLSKTDLGRLLLLTLAELDGAQGALLEVLGALSTEAQAAEIDAFPPLARALQILQERPLAALSDVPDTLRAAVVLLADDTLEALVSKTAAARSGELTEQEQEQMSASVKLIQLHLAAAERAARLGLDALGA